ncbi:MAG TPA: LysR substrate-binding domain-containing protein [Terriglobia bacterium]|nr:LysR substrate-binding domain-containing protein [Terriglobia bacterium]
MNRLRRLLPPVSSLVVFEAAGRLNNFTAAAQELNVTQAAVSRQILGLEAHLGVALFHRQHRQVRLTAEGITLHQAVSQGLLAIVDCVQRLTAAQNRAAISIGATLGFATLWLMPRLSEFNAEHPDIQLRLISSDSLGELADEQLDLAIRYGTGNWSDVKATRMFDGEVFPVCSPAFLERFPIPAGISDIGTLPLLEMEALDPTWTTWEAWRTALSAPRLNSRRLRFNNYPLLIQSAIAGQGLALGWRYLVDDALNSGQLIRPFPGSFKTNLDFYVIEPANRRESTPVATLKSWLLQHAAKAEAEARRRP